MRINRIRSRGIEICKTLNIITEAPLTVVIEFVTAEKLRRIVTMTELCNKQVKQTRSSTGTLLRRSGIPRCPVIT